VAEKSNFQCDIRASFATAFTAWRRKNKIPLKQLGKELGLSVSTVSSWETGEGNHFCSLLSAFPHVRLSAFCSGPWSRCPSSVVPFPAFNFPRTFAVSSARFYRLSSL